MTRSQQDHPGNTPEVKITSWIILIDKVYDKKARGQPPKVKFKNTDRVASADNHAGKDISLRSPQVYDEFSSQPEVHPVPPEQDRLEAVNPEVKSGPLL